MFIQDKKFGQENQLEINVHAQISWLQIYEFITVGQMSVDTPEHRITVSWMEH